ncbi:23S rRNA (uracil(1939)-C(5))-methyltransferase RlmD [uncultured Acetatifactor sp.]|uniref:23S rRNA (uracil(1939)-C(5))-methyltransferase RlmD n=1 Tax=uncultured Acetatifactor sp. TaxID=1671927 RepID=UPI00262FD412|nr:23S rRNA (uracil(1939)-C(5))-methyltransferase RlmD [uncultured Acetatifactor sp.]
MKFQKNELAVVTIEDMGSDGFGIGKVDGFALFVKDAVVGDRVEARIVKSKKNYAYARLEKVIEPSPFRVEPKCHCHRQCGGCQLQVLSYEKQLDYKQDKIRNSLIRIGGFAPEEVDRWMELIVGMEEPFRYRNKAQYPVGRDREGNVVAGFYAGRTHSIIPNTDCLLGPVENETVMEAVLDYMRENRVSAYDEASGTGLVRHVLIRKGFVSGEIMVCLVINKKVTDVSCGVPKEMVSRGKDIGTGRTAGGMRSGTEGCRGLEGESAEGHRGLKGRAVEGCRYERRAECPMPGEERSFQGEFLPRQDRLLRKLTGIAGMTSISVSIQTERTNVIMGREIHTIWGKDCISDTIRVRDMESPGWPYTGRELTFHISPLSFYQVNPVQTEKLYSLALEYAGLTGQETVWDLYCGIGTISLFLADKAKQVYGVEIVPQAIEDARENAVRNGIGNASFFVGKAEEVLQKFCHGGDWEDAAHPDVVVVDPPRKGCDNTCLRAILAAEPERIVYVSCDPATLARDLRVLCDGGYGIERVRGMDQFGMTVHCETIVLLSHKSPDSHINVKL